MYWGLLSRLFSKYSVIVILPVSATIGFVGYKIEQMISDRYTPTLESVKDKRERRLLENQQKDADSIKEHTFVPKTIFEKNLSPSLQKPDPRLEKFKNNVQTEIH